MLVSLFSRHYKFKTRSTHTAPLIIRCWFNLQKLAQLFPLLSLYCLSSGSHRLSLGRLQNSPQLAGLCSFRLAFLFLPADSVLLKCGFGDKNLFLLGISCRLHTVWLCLPTLPHFLALVPLYFYSCFWGPLCYFMPSCVCPLCSLRLDCLLPPFHLPNSYSSIEPRCHLRQEADSPPFPHLYPPLCFTHRTWRLLHRSGFQLTWRLTAFPGPVSASDVVNA